MCCFFKGSIWPTSRSVTLFHPPTQHSQLIIITGTSYEALASEGIQLNMGGGNVEEVTCTVIGGVTYDPASESKVRAAEHEDSVTGAIRAVAPKGAGPHHRGLRTNKIIKVNEI